MVGNPVLGRMPGIKGFEFRVVFPLIGSYNGIELHQWGFTNKFKDIRVGLYLWIHAS